MSSEALVVGIYALLCTLSLLPFVTVAQPPITDLANHAARLNLACSLGDPSVAAMYDYRLGIIPNLAVDLVNRPLCGLVDAATVLKLVTAGSFLLIYASAWLIQRKLFGRANAFLFALPALAFNLVTTMGYVNYFAGVAIAFLLVALAIGRERRFRTMLLLGNLGGTALFFCHIFALAFGILVFFGLMLQNNWRSVKGFSGAALRTAAMFALPLSLVAFVPTDSHPLVMGFVGKLRNLAAPFMAQHLFLGVYGVAFAGLLYLRLRDSAELHPLFRAPVAVTALFILLVPSRLAEAVDIDSRTLVALAYLFFAALKPTRRERETTIVLACISATVVAFQLWAMLAIWQPFSRQVDEFRRATAILPTQAKVLPVGESEGPRLIALPIAYSHVTSYATIDRRVFNPIEFTGVGMQPLSVTPAYDRVAAGIGPVLDVAQASDLASPDTTLRQSYGWRARFAENWPQNFDYVIYYHFGRARNFNPALLSEVHSGSFFSILKVRKPARV